MKETTANKTYTLTSLSTQEADILTALSRHPFNNQRELATFTGHALGVVNKSVRNLIVETVPTALTKAKMAFDYRVVRESDGELLVTGHTQNVFTKKETGKITRIPDKFYLRLKAAMEKFNKENTSGNDPE